MNKNQDLLQIEQCFGMIKQKHSVESNLSRISSILSRQFNSKKFKISIIKNDKNFVGMCCFPEASELDDVIDELLHGTSRITLLDKYKKINNWVIEIDEKLLYDRNLNANPAELTAVLLHEIGHIVYSDSIVNRMTKVILVDYLALNNKVKKLIKHDRIRNVLGITALETFMIKSYSSNPLKSELVADKFAVTYGYGQDLQSFVDKLLVFNGSSLINKSDAQIESELKVINQWAIENISELQYRKTKLRSMLKAETLANPSMYVKNYIGRVKANFFGEDNGDLVKQMVVEQQIIKDYNRILKESIVPLFDKIGRVKKVTNQDIDDIYIDVNRAENYEDTKFIVLKIQDKIDLIDEALEQIEKNRLDKVQDTKLGLTNKRKALIELKQQALQKRFVVNRKAVMINYPDGYKG